MSEPYPAEHRASHADREDVVERLQQAAGDGRLTLEELEERIDAAYAARTYADLAPLTADLPSAGAGLPTRPGSPLPQRVTGAPGRRWSLGLMSGVTRRGHWVIGGHHAAVSVMGGVSLDLREAELESREVTVWAFAMMGGVDIAVPPDCALVVDGLGLMGSFDQQDKAPPPPADAPVVRVRGLSCMGGVSAVRRPRQVKPDSEPPSLEPDSR